jgi:hypothetical protein
MIGMSAYLGVRDFAAEGAENFRSLQDFGSLHAAESRTVV